MISSASSSTHHLSARTPEGPLGRGVELDDLAFVVHRDDHVQRRLEDGGLAGLRAAHGQLRPPALGDVAADEGVGRAEKPECQQGRDREGAEGPPDARPRIGRSPREQQSFPSLDPFGQVLDLGP